MTGQLAWLNICLILGFALTNYMLLQIFKELVKLNENLKSYY